VIFQFLIASLFRVIDALMVHPLITRETRSPFILAPQCIADTLKNPLISCWGARACEPVQATNYNRKEGRTNKRRE
jgi:hypothetical protein